MNELAHRNEATSASATAVAWVGFVEVSLNALG